ncbi:MAG: DUF2157 domain-containing protein [Pseudomonadota bacterium]
MGEDSKTEAQKRADQVSHFNTELKQLIDEDVLKLSEEQLSSLKQYHTKLIATLSDKFDIDVSSKEKRLSFGMRVASFLGALALAVSVFFLFYQYWGRFSTVFQITVLAVAPLVMLFATYYVAQREKTGYFSKLLGLVTFACFVLNIFVLGQIYNITPSDRAFIVWGALAFLLAYTCDVRLLLVAGIICIGGFLSARVGVWYGLYWAYFGHRPENFLPIAAMLFATPFYIPHKHFTAFDTIYRVFALLLFFIPVLILSYWGAISYMTFDQNTIEVMYQIIGFVFSAGLIALGIRKGMNDVVNTANTFFVIFLYTKVYDWWWDWMPKYLFFLLVGAIAVLMLFVFKRLRGLTKSKEQETNA